MSPAKNSTHMTLLDMATPAPSLDGGPVLTPKFSGVDMDEVLPPPPPPSQPKVVSDPPAGSVAASLKSMGPPAPSLDSAPKRSRMDKFADYELVHVDDLVRDPQQPRKTFKQIEELAKSLEAIGMLQPITARWVGVQRMIMYGERRWLAAKHLGWTHVPAITRKGTPESILKKQLQENTQRSAMDPIDIAHGIRQIMKDEKLATHMQVAESLGHSQTWVSQHLALLELEESDQRAVSVGAISVAEGAARGRKVAGRTRAPNRNAAKTKTVTITVPARATVAKEPTPIKAERNSHFGASHPLSAIARGICGHTSNQLLPGAIACGPCWESVIRKDAVGQANTA